MGWSFYGDSRIDKKAIIQKLKEPGSLAPGYEMLDSAVVGNNFWYLMRAPDGEVTIGLNLMKSGGAGYGWGTKELTESMGPNELNCPLRFMDKVSAPKHYAAEWRERVRAYHAEQAKRKVSRPAYAEGQLWQYPNGPSYRLISKLHGRKGWIVECSEHKGIPYRAGFNILRELEYAGEYQTTFKAA